MAKKTKPEDIITAELRPAHPKSSHTCALCGEFFEAGPILASATHDRIIDVCLNCINWGEPDAGLERRAEELEAHALYLRSLIGRLKLPTHEEWEARCVEHQREYMREYQREYGMKLQAVNFFTGGILNDPDDSEIPF